MNLSRGRSATPGSRPPLDRGRPGEEDPDPGEHLGARLVAGEQQGEDGVAELPLARALGEQHPQRVVVRAPGRGRGAAPREDLPGELAKLGDPALGRAVRRPLVGAHLVDRRGHRLADPGGSFAEVDAEERLPDDLDGQAHQLRVEVDPGPLLAHRLPALEHAAGRRDDRAAARLDPRPLEGGLRQPPLPRPGLAAAGQQAVAEQRLQGVVGGEALLVAAVRIAQHVLDVVRVRDQVPGSDPVVDPHHVPVVPLQGEKVGERIDLGHVYSGPPERSSR